MSIKSLLKAGFPIVAILLNAGSQASLATANEALNVAGQAQSQAKAMASTAESATSAASKAYFLHIEGRALPLKQVLVNGVNVLGGAVISLSLPVNISGYTKPGLNTVQLDFVSDPKSNLVVAVEKRTPGPKTEELIKITAAADESKGQPKTSSVSFNLPDDGYIASVGDLKDLDKESIADEFSRYYRAIASTRADQVRSLYRQSLAEERKLCPESARFFENVLNREVAILKNKALKLNPLNRNGLGYKVEGDSVKLYRLDSKPLIESNEVNAQISPILIEVGAEKGVNGETLTKQALKDKLAKLAVKSPRPISQSEEKSIEIPLDAFTPATPAPALSQETSQETSQDLAQEIPIIHHVNAAPLEVKNSDGTIVATEIKVGEETTVFDGSKPAGSEAALRQASRDTEKDRRPPKTAVKERLVRFNLYFKPSKPDSAGRRSWVVSLPPNT